MRWVRVGSRRSALAQAQARLVMDAVRAGHPDVEFELVTVQTTGDVDMRPFSGASDPFGIKGLFTRELEDALLRGELDLAVHSLKDLPMKQDERLPLVALSRRGDPRDALLLPRGADGSTVPDDGLGPIGCSSARRRLQLETLFPGRPVEPVRGNIQTRLRKLDEPDESGKSGKPGGRPFSMLVLAAAGLRRLGLEGRIDRLLSPDEMVPAAGQGILACQGRAGEDYAYLDVVRDRDAEDCAVAERSFVAALGGGCALPVAAYAVAEGDVLNLSGFYADETLGVRRTGRLSGPRTEAGSLGRELAARLRAARWEDEGTAER